MVKRIKVLPPNLANIIAAGEVIERPAAVVKELLENALDAQATHIEIKIAKGGKRLIRVIDDGVGIWPEDLPLAIQRHSTSKIEKVEDLSAINTLGFRGEALASMAAVSRMKIASRVADKEWGYEIIVEGGKIKSKQEIGMPVGTIIEVRDLFFNTPARGKFLKRDTTEMAHIYETVIRISLCYPHKSFMLETEKRNLLRLSKARDLRERVGQIYNLELAKSLKKVSLKKDNIVLKGFMAPVHYSRPSTREMFFYVNGRWVRSSFLNQAVYKALTDLWPKGRYPFLVFFITLPPSEVDVNVHPTKQEVKFKNHFLIQSMIEEGIKQGLEQKLADMILEPGLETKPSDAPLEEDVPLELPLPLPKKNEQFPSFGDKGLCLSTKPSFRVEDSLVPYRLKKKRPWRILGQLWQTYIVCEAETAMILIDQHAAHERLNYERLKQIYNKGCDKGQELLTPIVLELNVVEATLLKEIMPELQKLGFYIEGFGEKSFLIRRVPVLLAHKDVKGILEGIIKDMEACLKMPNMAEIAEGLLKSMACHMSVRAHDPLTEEEIKYLLEQILELKILHCPHGRPFYKLFDKKEIGKFFDRN